MAVELVHVTKAQIGPFAAGLRALEASMLYPIDDGADHFRIDHGETYHPFFSELGEAHFLVALDEGRVVGNIVGVRRQAQLRGRDFTSFYMCDYKIAPEHRGGSMARKIWIRCLKRLASDPRLRGWRFVYGAAMRGSRGDVSRSYARKIHPGHLFAPAARMKVYFTDPEALAMVDPSAAPCPPDPATGLDLSPDAAKLWESTAGRKDLKLVSTGKHWPLVHLPEGPSAWQPTWGHHLVRAGEALAEKGRRGPVCFAIDERLQTHIAWAESQGIVPGASCTVHTLSLPWLLRGTKWLHLATSHI